MKRIVLFVVSVMAVSTLALAQGREGRGAPPPPPPPLEPGASQADVDKALLAAPGQSEGSGDGHQVEARPDVRHAEERHEPSGLLRPVGLSAAAAVLD